MLKVFDLYRRLINLFDFEHYLLKYTGIYFLGGTNEILVVVLGMRRYSCLQLDSEVTVAADIKVY